MDGRCSSAVALVAAAVFAASVPLTAQPATTDRAAAEMMARRVAERVRSLQREADRLAGEARTVVGDLRRLEVQRDLASERARQADAEAAAAEQQLRLVSDRLTAVEAKRVADLPDLRARFVELYKRGPGTYARMLAGVRDLRELGRATRAVSSLARINQQRIDDHRRTLEAVRAERAAVQARTRELHARRAEAQQARGAAERALAARAALVADIDRRRDLNAQLAGELLVAQQKLDAAVKGVATGPSVEAVSVPFSAFRGALDWPVAGTVIGGFGQPNRMAAGSVRNGIEIAAPEGSPVRAVHPGTVGYAGTFTGYGNLVIVDHGGGQYTLYGYLASATTERGQRVEAGDELGRVGLAPAADPALYFEVRVDGRSVDPVQWLRRQ